MDAERSANVASLFEGVEDRVPEFVDVEEVRGLRDGSWAFR